MSIIKNTTYQDDFDLQGVFDLQDWMVARKEKPTKEIVDDLVKPENRRFFVLCFSSISSHSDRYPGEPFGEPLSEASFFPIFLNRIIDNPQDLLDVPEKTLTKVACAFRRAHLLPALKTLQMGEHVEFIGLLFHSPVVRQMYGGSWKETLEGQGLELATSESNWKLVNEFFDAGTITTLNLENISEVFDFAEFWQIQDLSMYCKEFIEGSRDNEAMIQIVELLVSKPNLFPVPAREQNHGLVAEWKEFRKHIPAEYQPIGPAFLNGTLRENEVMHLIEIADNHKLSMCKELLENVLIKMLPISLLNAKLRKELLKRKELELLEEDRLF